MSSEETFPVTPIGHVVGGREEVRDDHWGAVEAVIRLDATQYGPEAVAGLGDFSHLEVVFQFHLVPESKIETGARHLPLPSAGGAPSGREDWPLVGIFGQRGKNRPNRLGVSRCELVKVDGLDLHVRGLDAVEGTPVLDLKPWMREFGPRGEIRQPEWATELMGEYYL